MRTSNAERLETLLRCIDLTSLEESDTPERIAAMCERALRPDPDDPGVPPVAAVCIFPRFVALARERLAAARVRVAAAAGAFPEGRGALADRLAEIRRAIEDGADEIDTVLDHAAVRAGHIDSAAETVVASRAACGSDVTLKVILETGSFDSAASIRDAATLAIESGADFVKSSTGKVGGGATIPAARAIAEAVRDLRERTGRRVGVKVAGGIRTADQALEYIDLVQEVLGPEWLGPDLFRIGASSLLDDVVRALRA